MTVHGFGTRVGISVGDPQRPTHVAVVREPETGAMLRTKGRFYALVEVDGRLPNAREVAREAAELTRDEYYYDQTGGIDVSLRRAVAQANRRVHQKLRTGALQFACAVLCRDELFVLRAGAVETLVVRRARLFVPGQLPGELVDHAFREETERSAPLGEQGEVLAAVWRGRAEPGDTVLLVGSGLAASVDLEELKNAVLTLHPAAAAKQVHDRFASEAGRGAAALLIVEVAAAGAAPRLRAEPTPAASDPEAAAIAERIRDRLDLAWGRRPRIGRVLVPPLSAIAGAISFPAAVMRELLPHARLPLPRATETAAFRAARRRRMTIVLAVLAILVSGGVLALAYSDFEDANERARFNQAILEAERDIAAARDAASKEPPNITLARTELEQAEQRLAQAAEAKRADPRRIEELRAEIASLREKVTSVITDLAKVDAQSKPLQLDFTGAGLWVTDAGAGRLYRIGLDGGHAVVAQKGQSGMGAPHLLATLAEVVYVMDENGKLFRVDTRGIREIAIRDRRFSQPVDFEVFVNNLYVLDRASGQVWKYEPSADGQYNGNAIPFLAQPLGPNAVRALAVDGDVWVTTDEGELFRFRRPPGSATAARLDFTIRWTGERARAVGLQVREEEQELFLLDATARRVVVVGRDGRERSRVALPAELPEPQSFAVVHGGLVIITLHSAQLARTDAPR
jgi:hypothetical protein